MEKRPAAMIRGSFFCLLVLFAFLAAILWLMRPAAESPQRLEAAQARVDLEDGVYPVVPDDEEHSGPDAKGTVIELMTVPVAVNEAAEKIRLLDRPLLRFRNVSNFDFMIEMGECREIGFQNTDALKKHTRDHVGSRLAVVIDNRVVSHHKIREAIETQTVRITCCTVGGGDHLHRHLTELKAAAGSNK